MPIGFANETSVIIKPTEDTMLAQKVVFSLPNVFSSETVS